MGIKKLEVTKLEGFLAENKEMMDKYPSLTPCWGTSNYILKYKPTLENFIQDLKSFKFSEKDKALYYNIEKSGFTAEKDYILYRLGYKETKNKEEKISKKIKKQAEVFKILFNTNKNCFIRIRNKVTNEIRSYNINDLKDPYKLQSIVKSKYFSNTEDLMYTLNAFNKMNKADEDSLFSLQNLALDIDIDIQKTTVRNALNKLRILWERGIILTPTIIEYGHRIRLVYSIEDVPVSKKSLKIAKEVLQEINNKIPVEFNSSPQPLTSYARFNGTVNTKNSAIVNIKLEQTFKYKLKELQYMYLEKPEWVKKIDVANKIDPANKKSITNENFNDNRGKVIKFKNIYTLNTARLKDLECIQRIRQEGYRELLCYVYRNYCLLAQMSPEEAWRATKQFNNKFNEPLRENVLDSDTKHLNRKQYIHKNETLLKLFDISTSVEVELGLETVISEIEYKRRNNERNKKKYRAKVGKNIEKSKDDTIRELRAKIIKLKKQKEKNKDIAEQLKIPIKTLEGHITKLKKEGLL